MTIFLNKKALRVKCLNSEIFQNENKWVLETSYNNLFEVAELLSDKLNYDCHLQKTKFLCYLKSETRIEEGILALDLGVRAFLTGYSPPGLTIE
ncbi:hypothetical protein Glove_38g42 [Diversispora epigaea]|uniref:Uncharacterized protein n=1 Tax=Diversispora epigaea TaxID=1348612 RepID=A0A397JQP5_9GLOM|nr:hypothetical protein Glove_38g42 [Diversispora epigaea]